MSTRNVRYCASIFWEVDHEMWVLYDENERMETNMKMLVFYRSREFTNAIISSTQSTLKQRNIKGMEVEFVNLDKRNYEKLFKNMEELPEYVFVWFDEEKITDYINENYPTIKVIHFDKNNSTKKTMGGTYDCFNQRTDYKLGDLIIDTFKSNLVKKDVVLVDFYALTSSKEKLDDLDIGNKAASGRYMPFDTKKQADEYIITCLKKRIETK